jgi:hypothetical protein
MWLARSIKDLSDGGFKEDTQRVALNNLIQVMFIVYLRPMMAHDLHSFGYSHVFSILISCDSRRETGY